MPYLLQSLLDVRIHRKEKIQKLLNKAKLKLAEAVKELTLCKNKEKEFAEKKPGFMSKAYQNAINKNDFKRNYIILIKLKLKKLNEHQILLATKAMKAQNKVNKASENVEICSKLLLKAIREVSKIEEHKKKCKKEELRLAEIKQDKMLEEFKPKLKIL